MTQYVRVIGKKELGQIIKDKCKSSTLVQKQTQKGHITKQEKVMYVKNKPHNSIGILVRTATRKELFQYSVGKKMENAKKTEVFCVFLFHFFTKRSAAIRWQAQHEQKESKNKSKNSELQDTEFIEKLICFKLQ